MFYNVEEKRKLKDPFLAKDVCRFCHDNCLLLVGKKYILKESYKIGRNNIAYPNYEKDIAKIITEKYNYLVVDGYFQNLGNRGMPNDVYLFTYQDLNELIYNQINNGFEGLLHIVPIDKNNVESFVDSEWVLKIIEEGVFYLFDTNK